MEGRKRTPVIIDTDPGVDDVIAILLALASPEIEILAIIVCFGNSDVQSTCSNIYKLYQAVGRQIVTHPEDKAKFPNYTPVVPPILAVGPDGPLEGSHHFARYFHGRDGLGGITERHPDLNVCSVDKADDFKANFVPTTKSGVEVALELLNTWPKRSITYIVLGPPTNLALLNREHHQIVKDRIGRVILMGGAIDVPGNTSPVAEFNFFADPYAAKDLLCPVVQGQGLPLERVLLITLDITISHELPFAFYIQHVDPDFDSTTNPSVAAEKSPLSHFTSSFLERSREIMISFGKDVLELHDIVAIWCAIDNPPEAFVKEHDLPSLLPGWAAAKRKFDIERTGEITRGMLVVDRRDETTHAPGVNRSQAQSFLEETHQHDRSTVILAQVEMEIDDGSIGGPMDVACVVKTPGKDALLRLLTKRVWGVDIL
ncbi:nucleoside hydrolase [Paxillus ammoniavirescens]|nr:nucleoside hydrolase [Paxillus ammoniavirescens]